MGGTVAVTIRTSTGLVEPMARWTNPLPLFSHNIHFIECDETYVYDYMKQWYEMKQDWDDHHQTRKWTYPMTPTYAPWRLKAPIGFGLVVFDFSRRMILTMQDHTNFGFIYPETITPETENVYNDLVAKGRLYLVKRFYNKYADVQTCKIDTLDEVRFLDKVLHAKRNRQDYQFVADIFVDLQPWRVVRHPNTTNGALNFKQQMTENGFRFTPDEENQWSDWITDRQNFRLSRQTAGDEICQRDGND